MVKLPFQKRGMSKIQIQIQIHLFCHIMHFCPDTFICQPQLIFHSRFVSKLNFSSYKASAVHLIGNERGKKYYKKQSTDGSGSEISAAQRHRLYHLSVLSLQGSPEYNTSTDTWHSTWEIQNTVEVLLCDCPAILQRLLWAVWCRQELETNPRSASKKRQAKFLQSKSGSSSLRIADRYFQ